MYIDLGAAENFERAESGARFVVLGGRDLSGLTDRERDFIFHRGERDGSRLWGTLGPWKSAQNPLRGTLICSDFGETRSSVEHAGTATIKEIERVREARADHLNKNTGHAVIERYISLEAAAPVDARHRFTLDDMPSARLTVFVRSDEGALVYYQRMAFDGGPRPLVDPDDTDVEYLLPEQTDNNHECSNRDRLTYRVPLYASAEFEASGGDGDVWLESSAGSAYKIVIKVLVFKRQNSTSIDILRRVAAKLALKRHNILKYDPLGLCFEESGAENIALNKNTLLLLHGTFSSTQGTFGNLFERSESNGETFLSRLVSRDHFDQILAFDHDTIFLSPYENIARLDSLMNGRRVQQPIRAVGFSRGALVLKQLAIHCHSFQLEHGVTVSGANHVGYFSTLRNVRWFLSAMRQLLPASASLTMISSIAQHSSQVLNQLDGLRAMDSGSDISRSIITHPNVPASIIPIAGHDNGGGTSGITRIGQRVLNAAIGAALGTLRHDWVVAVREQCRVDPLTMAPNQQVITADGRHTRLIGEKLANEELRRALLWPNH
ncbi:DUF7379 domain-containing protein [Marinimicrobium alkaliphilum]|uniref:DUF7379 domain-containing protein n=1 Tax=Marinimicrobium alkaliphilum TaxID=2202654 RepID=UPI000DB9B773|nr:hypothetical protein [Marinimicrobium alkaliphilum]